MKRLRNSAMSGVVIAAFALALAPGCAPKDLIRSREGTNATRVYQWINDLSESDRQMYLNRFNSMSKEARSKYTSEKGRRLTDEEKIYFQKKLLIAII